MDLLWITDPHLDHLNGTAFKHWLRRLTGFDGDGVLLTGDIAEYETIPGFLAELRAVETPIWFVLGNHDAYGGSIKSIQAQVETFCRAEAHLHYLTFESAFQYAPGSYLMGEDGWADGRAGDFLASDIMLNDYRRIDELKSLTQSQRFTALKALGDEAAQRLERQLQQTLSNVVNHLTIATHVPPFVESCWYEGSNDINAWTPHFTALSVGEVIRDAAVDHPEVHFTVLCGHTHHAGQVSILENLTVLTGDADYGDWQRGRTIRLPNR
jgi:3',5'-cyclic-AMP phosphodiesterase